MLNNNYNYVTPNNFTNNNVIRKNTGDRFATAAFILSIVCLSCFGLELLAVIIIAVFNSVFFVRSELNYISYFVLLLIGSFCSSISFFSAILSLVFSIIATKKKTNTRKKTIFARVTSIVYLSTLVLMFFILIFIFIIAMMNGPYY